MRLDSKEGLQEIIDIDSKEGQLEGIDEDQEMKMQLDENKYRSTEVNNIQEYHINPFFPVK